MAYIPPMKGYKPFYIQATADFNATDTTAWGMVAQSNPFPALPDAKEPYKNNWLDSNGDDEYTSVMHYKPIEFSVKFYVKTFATENDSAVKILHDQLDSFFQKIKEGNFYTYDSYTGIGLRMVRYVGYKEEQFRARGNYAMLIFEVQFKCNDPITRMTISDNKIVQK